MVYIQYLIGGMKMETEHGNLAIFLKFNKSQMQKISKLKMDVIGEIDKANLEIRNRYQNTENHEVYLDMQKFHNKLSGLFVAPLDDMENYLANDGKAMDYINKEKKKFSSMLIKYFDRFRDYIEHDSFDLDIKEAAQVYYIALTELVKDDLIHNNQIKSLNVRSWVSAELDLMWEKLGAEDEKINKRLDDVFSFIEEKLLEDKIDDIAEVSEIVMEAFKEIMPGGRALAFVAKTFAPKIVQMYTTRTKSLE